MKLTEEEIYKLKEGNWIQDEDLTIYQVESEFSPTYKVLDVRKVIYDGSHYYACGKLIHLTIYGCEQCSMFGGK